MDRETIKRLTRKAVRDFLKNPCRETCFNIPRVIHHCYPSYSHVLCINTQHIEFGYTEDDCGLCPLGKFQDGSGICNALGYGLDCPNSQRHLFEEQYWEERQGEIFLALTRFAMGFKGSIPVSKSSTRYPDKEREDEMPLPTS